MNLTAFREESARMAKGISNNNIYRGIVKLLLNKHFNNMLDFGGGNGNLSRLIYDLNICKHITIADIIEKPANIPEYFDYVKCDLNNTTGLENESFDLILCCEVIEHLENPRALFRELFRLLKPGGILIVTTPNNESIRSIISLLFKKHFAAFTDTSYPAHITALLEKDLIRIAKENYFKDLKISFTNHGGIPKFPLITWQKISFGALKGKRFSDNILLLCQK